MSDRETEIDWSETATYAFDVVSAEFVVVTAGGADLKCYEPLSGLLRRMHKAFGVEFAFIAEWAGGDPVVRRTPQGNAPACDPLQCEYGLRLLEGDGAPEGMAFHAVPVATADGVVHGTLCCFMPERKGEGASRALGSVAQLIAAWFNEADLSLSGLMPLRGHSMMGGLPMTIY
ncbi:hypothetical protein [Ramlibacter sp. PS4R-6]|uniref:hypothetical protein n=1 Tax=Ramlibacter sp. PS4R-6 TaxID=3133438 RepID=UPI0030A6BB5D